MEYSLKLYRYFLLLLCIYWEIYQVLLNSRAMNIIERCGFMASDLVFSTLYQKSKIVTEINYAVFNDSLVCTHLNKNTIPICV